MNKLYRSKSDRWIAGVCGGLGKFTGVPSIVFRLIFLFAGVSLFVYLLLWIFIQEDPKEANVKVSNNPIKIVLIILILLFVVPLVFSVISKLLGWS